MLLTKFLEFKDENGTTINLLFSAPYHPLDGEPEWRCNISHETLKAIESSEFMGLEVYGTPRYTLKKQAPTPQELSERAREAFTVRHEREPCMTSDKDMSWLEGYMSALLDEA